MAKRNRPSFGRPRKERGLDQFDTPPIALVPLFEHEPLLKGVTTICEPFCGRGNLTIAMRKHGLIVHASDIEDRGCPDSVTLDFRAMASRPPDWHRSGSVSTFANHVESVDASKQRHVEAGNLGHSLAGDALQVAHHSDRSPFRPVRGRDGCI